MRASQTVFTYYLAVDDWQQLTISFKQRKTPLYFLMGLSQAWPPADFYFLVHRLRIEPLDCSTLPDTEAWGGNAIKKAILLLFVVVSRTSRRPGFIWKHNSTENADNLCFTISTLLPHGLGMSSVVVLQTTLKQSNSWLHRGSISHAGHVHTYWGNIITFPGVRGVCLENVLSAPCNTS